MADVPVLLRGHRDEDDFVVMGLRFRSPGLTHTYRPGRRFGELFAPNAKTKLLRCVRRALSSAERARGAWWLGRACHLLGDMTVPARTRGVWHLRGDPFELWLEQHADSLEGLTSSAPRPAAAAPFASDAPSPPDAVPGALADGLAQASAAHKVFSYDRTKLCVHLYENRLAAQARTLVPLAIAHTSALLRAVPPSDTLRPA